MILYTIFFNNRYKVTDARVWQIYNTVNLLLWNYPVHISGPSGYGRFVFVFTFPICLLAIVLFILRFTDSDYPFGIVKLFYTISAYLSPLMV